MIYYRVLITVSEPVMSKKLQFGPSAMMGGTARLIMLGSIDACQPRRKRSRGGLVASLFWLLLLTSLGLMAWMILDGFMRGIIPTTLM